MKKTAGAVGFVLAGAIAINFITTDSRAKTPFGVFTQCVKASGTKLYVASIAELSGNFKVFAKAIGAVECVLPDRTQKPECAAKNFPGYPAWEFPNGSVKTSVLPVQDVAQNSGCAL